MSTNKKAPRIPLPKGWKQHVRSAVLHVISVAQYATVYTRSWAADNADSRVRLKAELDRANQEIGLLREEMRIKDARMARIDPHRRPHYPPVERMAILQLRAARAWSLERTARVFHLTAPTISVWMRRLEDEGADGLVQLREPVNRFPDFVRYGLSRSIISRVAPWVSLSLRIDRTAAPCAAPWDRRYVARGRHPNTSCAIATASLTATRSGGGQNAKASVRLDTVPSVGTAASLSSSDSS